MSGAGLGVCVLCLCMCGLLDALLTEAFWVNWRCIVSCECVALFTGPLVDPGCCLLITGKDSVSLKGESFEQQFSSLVKWFSVKVCLSHI